MMKKKYIYDKEKVRIIIRKRKGVNKGGTGKVGFKHQKNLWGKRN